MALNESKRRRSVPEWMKDSSKTSPQKSSASKGNLSHVQRTQRPSYPPISVRKTKQLCKPSGDGELETERAAPSDMDSVQPLDDCQEPQLLSSHSSSSRCDTDMLWEVTNEELDQFVMTVDDLTNVAQEIIKEERRKRTSDLLSHLIPKCARK